MRTATWTLQDKPVRVETKALGGGRPHSSFTKPPPPHALRISLSSSPRNTLAPLLRVLAPAGSRSSTCAPNPCQMTTGRAMTAPMRTTRRAPAGERGCKEGEDAEEDVEMGARGGGRACVGSLRICVRGKSARAPLVPASAIGEGHLGGGTRWWTGGDCMKLKHHLCFAVRASEGKAVVVRVLRVCQHFLKARRGCYLSG
jgi:hypothetical protein